MSVHDAVSEYRLGLVAVIEASGNKRLACVQAGIHHSTFYRWRNQPAGQRRRVSWRERHLGERIVAAALAHPGDGPQRVADCLGDQGVAVSPSKVWRTLVKHRLNTRGLRYQLLAQHRQGPTPSIQVSPRAPEQVGRLDAEIPGDLVQFDCSTSGRSKKPASVKGKPPRGRSGNTPPSTSPRPGCGPNCMPPATTRPRRSLPSWPTGSPRISPDTDGSGTQPRPTTATSSVPLSSVTPSRISVLHTGSSVPGGPKATGK